MVATISASSKKVIIFNEKTGLFREISKEKTIFIWKKGTKKHEYIEKEAFEKNQKDFVPTREGETIEFFNRKKRKKEYIPINDVAKRIVSISRNNGKKRTVYEYYYCPRPPEKIKMNYLNDEYGFELVPITKTRKVIDTTNNTCKYFYVAQTEKDLKKQFSPTKLEINNPYRPRRLTKSFHVQNPKKI